MQLSRRRSSADSRGSGLAAESRALLAALTDLVRVYQFRDRDRICCHDVSVTQCYALQALVVSGPQRLNDLAACLRLDKSTASRVVDALERKGYASRLTDTSDGRAVALTATAAGRKLHQRIESDLAREHEKIVADLTPEARRAAIEVIRRLAHAAKRRIG